MQSYSVASAFLILATLATTAYAWHAPVDSTPRVAILRHAKPAPVVFEPASEVAAEASPAAVEISLSSPTSNTDNDSVPSDPLLRSELPEAYNQLNATAEPKETTELGEIFFSTDITSNYEAINPGNRFTEGFYTIYATFSYDDMVNGTVWSWVWRQNGEVIDGGNQVWEYGPDGPGYVYIQPESGFSLGNYELTVWVNGELLTQSNFSITEGVSAAN